MKWRERDGVRWLEAELPGARAAFSTRVGGVSAGAFESLNLGLYTDDDRGGGDRTNRAPALPPRSALSPDAGCIRAAGPRRRGDRAATAPRSGRARSLSPAPRPEADGHVVAADGLAALVYVADCLPVAIAGPGGAAMLHCGWRGLAAGIVARGAAAVGATAPRRSGRGSAPAATRLATRCWRHFAALGAGIAAGRMLDLPEVARRLLAEAGVEQVESSRPLHLL